MSTGRDWLESRESAGEEDAKRKIAIEGREVSKLLDRRLGGQKGADRKRSTGRSDDGCTVNAASRLEGGR